MKLLADENVKGRLISWLKANGHDVIATDKGVRNSQLFILANSENRILLTNDTDFLSTDMYPTQDTAGRIILRIFPPTFANQKDSLAKAFNQLTEENCKGKLVIISRDGFEIFPLATEEFPR